MKVLDGEGRRNRGNQIEDTATRERRRPAGAVYEWQVRSNLGQRSCLSFTREGESGWAMREAEGKRRW